MKKFLSYLIIIFSSFMIFITGIKALVCNYESTGGNMTHKLVISEKNDTISKSFISGDASWTTDKDHGAGYNNIEEDQSVENWDKNYQGIDFKAQSWYRANEHKCLPYSILIDTSSGLDLILSDNTNLENYKNKYNSYLTKQGIVVMDYVPPKEDEDDPKAPNACYGLNESTCKNNPTFSCVWNEKTINNVYYEYCNTDQLLYVSCGEGNNKIKDIPYQVPKLVSFFVDFLKIGTPIILIIVGMITLLKALASSKEEDIKKAQGSLVKKLIAGAMVFFVISIVEFVVSLVADSNEVETFSTCLDCFLQNDCEKNIYYKTTISDTEWCTYLNTNEFKSCSGK